VVGLPVHHAGALYNGAAFVHRGNVVAIKAKSVLAGRDVYYEPRWFTPWPAGTIEDFPDLPGCKIGDVLLAFDDCTLGFEVCEEAWCASPHADRYRGMVDIVLNPSASHFYLDKPIERRQLFQKRAQATDSIYVFCNTLGLDA